MEERTVSFRGDLGSGRIIVAVTVLGPDRPEGDVGTPRVDTVEPAIERPADVLPDGSVEELRDVMHRALTRAGRLPLSSDSGGTVAGIASDWERLIEVRLRSRAQDLYAEALTFMERQLLTRVLEHAAGNQSQAARILGITRGCLRAKIRTLGITIGHSVRSDSDQLDRPATSDDPQDTYD